MEQAFEHQDKVLHFVGGAAIGAVSTVAVERLWPDAHPIAKRVLAIIPAVVAGIGKEVYDHQHPDENTSDPWDAAATILGGGIAIEIVFRW